MLGQRHSVFYVGAPGLDGIERNSARRDYKNVLVTYHPETMAEDYGVAGCRAMLKAISTSLLGYGVIFCGVNADPGGAEIKALIQEHIKKHGGIYRDDITHADYIDLMQHSALVIGNSSAGIIEAPWVGVPTVNIGNRQKGRPHAHSVHWSSGDVPHDYDVEESIRMALAFRGDCAPQYTGGAAPKIASICREFVENGRVEPWYYPGGPNGFGAAVPR